MKIDRGAWFRGLQSGVSTTWTLSKIIIPVTIAVTLIQHTPLIHWIVVGVSPLMSWFGLPGESAVVLALGFILNIYAAIGAMFLLPLSSYHIFVLSIMLSFSHNLIVESAVAKKLGLSASLMVVIRILLAFAAAAIVRLIYGAEAGASTSNGADLLTSAFIWQIPITALLWEIISKLANSIWQLTIIVIPLMLGIQILKELRALQWLSRSSGPFLRLLGLPEQATIPLLAGMFFGLAFGAGVILESAKEVHLTKRQLSLMILFLILSHSVVEDTLLFVPLGVNPWLLLGVRVVAAIMITASLSRLWKEREVENMQFM